MGFSRQESWSGLPFSSPGDLPDPRIEPGSPALQADSLPSELPEKTLNKNTLVHVGRHFEWGQISQCLPPHISQDKHT